VNPKISLCSLSLKGEVSFPFPDRHLFFYCFLSCSTDCHDDELMMQEVKKRLSSEAVAAANQNGRWKNQMRRVAHNGCCRRVAQTRALCSGLWKLLTSEGLFEALKNIEIPLVNILLLSAILP